MNCSLPNGLELVASSERLFTARRPSRSAGWLVVLLTLAAMACTGCAPLRGLRENLEYNDSMNDTVMGWRNSVWARQSWHEHKYEHLNEPQFISFGQGFRSGYADVAGGGNGCVPALPPRPFWTWKYQTAEGQAKVAAWFAGYPYGAAAAKEDGAGNHQQIQVSHLIEAQYSPEFRAGFCPGCDPSTVPGWPGMETLPSTGEVTPLPTETPAGPAAMIDPTSQATPTGQWPHPSVLTRVPPTTSPSRSSRYAVVPASAQMLVP